MPEIKKFTEQGPVTTISLIQKYGKEPPMKTDIHIESNVIFLCLIAINPVFLSLLRIL